MFFSDGFFQVFDFADGRLLAVRMSFEEQFCSPRNSMIASLLSSVRFFPHKRSPVRAGTAGRPDAGTFGLDDRPLFEPVGGRLT